MARLIWDIEIGTQLPRFERLRQEGECYPILDEELARKGIRVHNES